MSFSHNTLLKELTVGQFEKLLLSLCNSQSTSNTTYLNTNEAAEFIRKSPQALRQIVYNRKIKSIKRGNNLLFKKSDLIDWIESGIKVHSSDNVFNTPCLIKPQQTPRFARRTKRK